MIELGENNYIKLGENNHNGFEDWDKISKIEGHFNLYTPKESFTEITHTDGSIQVFQRVTLLNSKLPRVSKIYAFFFDSKSFKSYHPKMNTSGQYYYFNPELGTITNVHTYPRETRITAILEATKSFLHVRLQKIISEYIERD